MQPCTLNAILNVFFFLVAELVSSKSTKSKFLDELLLQRRACKNTVDPAHRRRGSPRVGSPWIGGGANAAFCNNCATSDCCIWSSAPLRRGRALTSIQRTSCKCRICKQVSQLSASVLYKLACVSYVSKCHYKSYIELTHKGHNIK